MSFYLGIFALLFAAAVACLFAFEPAYVRTERDRKECESRTCHDPWKKPELNYRLGRCVCLERP